MLFRDACFHFQSQGCKRGGHSEEAGRALKGSISRSGKTEGDRSRFEERSFLYSPVKPRTLRSQLGSMETRGRKDWPALLSNREFLHPANWDQDQLRRAGAPGWVYDVEGRSQSSLCGTACTPQPSLSLWEWHSVPAGNSECLGQTYPHGETRLLLLCF